MEARKNEPELAAISISKRFGHIVALRDVTLRAYAGEVLALVGDNGAGKSTLFKTVTGVHRPDSGELRLRGQQVSLHTPGHARKLGVAAVFQDLALVECLDISSNMFLGEIPHRRFVVDRRQMDREAESFLERMGMRVSSARTPVGMLSGGQRQTVAIARALRLDASVVAMDEPTAALGVRESAQVLSIIERLRDEGKAVVVVSHDLESVFRIADRVQVLRLGRTVGLRRRSETDRSEIIAFITGAKSPELTA